MSSIRQTLESESAKLGFARVRIAVAGPPPCFERYDAFLEAGYEGEMAWLRTGRDARSDVRNVLPGAQSVAVLAMDFGHPSPPDPGGLTGRVASYAWGRDYHNLVGKRLRKLRRALEAAVPGLRTWSSVDAGPAWERGWAAAAGLGFVGRNGLVLLPSEGSLFFVAILLLSEAIPPDAPVSEHCGRCRRCVDACPTAAILEGGGLDARRCLSYLTIEHRGPIPEALRPKLGRWVFGCDDCQDVCPHVHLRRPTDPDFAPRNAWLDLPALLDTPDEALLARFEGSPIRRACPEKLKRNAAVVLGNLGDPAARPALERAWRSATPLVSEHAGWALARLGA